MRKKEEEDVCASFYHEHEQQAKVDCEQIHVPQAKVDACMAGKSGCEQQIFFFFLFFFIFLSPFFFLFLFFSTCLSKLRSVQTGNIGQFKPVFYSIVCTVKMLTTEHLHFDKMHLFVMSGRNSKQAKGENTIFHFCLSTCWSFYVEIQSSRLGFQFSIFKLKINPIYVITF